MIESVDEHAPASSPISRREAIRFYCGIGGELSYNHHPVYTGPYACVSLVYGSTHKRINRVHVPAGVQVFEDSGAFNDACLLLRGNERRFSLMREHRLSLKEALQRQERHAEQFGYADQIEARASYDVLIDETWSQQEGSGVLIRQKRRWSEADAQEAVEETVAAAGYLDQHRLHLESAGRGASAISALRAAHPAPSQA